jgi:hypothetical protein
VTETIEITIEIPAAENEPRHRAESPANPTPIFEEIVNDRAFRPATRFITSQSKGKHVLDAN